jgi:hypothetical protein
MDDRKYFDEGEMITLLLITYQHPQYRMLVLKSNRCGNAIIFLQSA